jgi:hypothetical protein
MRLHLPIRLLNAVLSSFRRMGRTVGTATVIAASMISGAFADELVDISVTWDSAWNLTSTTPTQGYNITLSETTTSLYDADKKQDSIGYVYVVDSTLDSAIVAGGLYDTEATYTKTPTAIEGDIWLDVKSGTYKLILGGSTANNWSSGTVFSITGNVMTQVEGSTSAALVVGGIFCDGQSPTLTGNVYTSVQGNAVITGTLVGGGLIAHGATNTITGSTYVSIQNIQGTTSEANWDATTNSIARGYIIAGSAQKWNRGTSVIRGNTNLTVNNESLSGTFVKNLVGGSYTAYSGNGGTLNIEGNTNVSVIGNANVTYSGNIYGGSYSTNGKVAISGSTNLSLKNGVYTGSIYGGSYNTSSSKASGIGQNVTTTLEGGTFQGAIVGGSAGSGATTIGGNVSLTIKSGTFSNTITAGSTGSNASITGNVSATV